MLAVTVSVSAVSEAYAVCQPGFWDTKLELGNSNWIPVICADYYADNWVDCKLSATNEFSGIWSFSS